jgi:hypothetical protein
MNAILIAAIGSVILFFLMLSNVALVALSATSIIM